VIAGLQCQAIGFCHLRHARELALDPFQALFQWTLVEPVDQTKHEEILAARLHATFQIEVLQRIERQGGGWHCVQLVTAAQSGVGERVFLVTRLGQIALRKGIPVNDQHPAGQQAWQVGLECCRVHGHQHIGGVTGGMNFPTGEMQLKTGDTRNGTGGRTNFGGIIRQRTDIIAEDGRCRRQLAASQLHAVTGIAAEQDGDLFKLLPGFGGSAHQALCPVNFFPAGADISTAFRRACDLLRVRRQVEHMLGKVIDKVGSDVLVAHTAGNLSVGLDDRYLPMTTLMH
jgi:hypothetical protein